MNLDLVCTKLVNMKWKKKRYRNVDYLPTRVVSKPFLKQRHSCIIKLILIKWNIQIVPLFEFRLSDLRFHPSTNEAIECPTCNTCIGMQYNLSHSYWDWWCARWKGRSMYVCRELTLGTLFWGYTVFFIEIYHSHSL